MGAESASANPAGGESVPAGPASPVPSLSVAIPARNEEETLPETFRLLREGLKVPDAEIIVVDDHSTDGTSRVIEEAARLDPRVRVVSNLRPPGFANAVLSGFAAARGRYVVPLMADLSDDLATIPKMMKKLDEGFDVVCGSRYMPEGIREGGRPVQGFFSRFVGWSLRRFAALPTHDASNAFKMYRREVLRDLRIRGDSFAVSLEIVVKAHVRGYKITEVPTTWHTRDKGQSKFRIFKVYRNYLRWWLWALVLRNWKV
ncbi:MAG: glycosyltransferase [Planctomycetota bacterium]